MKALRIHAFGDAGQAVLDTLPVPTATHGHVVVRVEAASVNPLDLKILAGHMTTVFPVPMPCTLGTDLAGVVEAVGPGVAGFAPGDRVVGRQAPTAGGAFAEHALVPASALCRMPATLGFEQAAALPTAAGTAWQALFRAGRLAAGQRVLVHAGAGGVGHFAVQFARQAGAHVVSTASAGNHPLLASLGARQAIDYRHTDFTDGGPDFDLVLDTVGGETLARSWQVLRPGGTLVSTVDPEVAPRDGRHGAFVFFQTDAPALAGILREIESGRLQAVLDSVHPLEGAHAALARVAGGHARGKVILRTAP